MGNLQRLNCPDMIIEDANARTMQLLITENWDPNNKFKMQIFNDLTSKLSKNELINTLKIVLEIKDSLFEDNLYLRQHSVRPVLEEIK